MHNFLIMILLEYIQHHGNMLLSEFIPEINKYKLTAIQYRTDWKMYLSILNITPFLLRFWTYGLFPVEGGYSGENTYSETGKTAVYIRWKRGKSEGRVAIWKWVWGTMSQLKYYHSSLFDFIEGKILLRNSEYLDFSYYSKIH